MSDPLYRLAENLKKLKTNTERTDYIRNPENAKEIIEAFEDQDLRQFSPNNAMEMLFSKYRCRILHSTAVVICQTLERNRATA